MKKVSVIVPVYNEQEVISYFYDEITKVFSNINYILEVLFVDDGSSDKTLKIIEEYSIKDKRVHYISFSRNFGKEAAIYAGLNHVTGNYVAVMDVDLQDPPKLLPKMIAILENKEYDYDIVGTRRVTRTGEPKIRSFFARKFYKIINKMSQTEMVSGARDFCLMRESVVKSIIKMAEYNRYSKGIFSFVGYNVKWLEYENIKRVAGKTKWSFWKLFKYAIEGIVGYTTMPLIWPFIFSFLFFLASIIVLIISIIKSLDFVYYSLCISLFAFGIILLFMGIIGEYLAKTYLEVKKRPIYIIRKTDMRVKNDKKNKRNV